MSRSRRSVRSRSGDRTTRSSLPARLPRAFLTRLPLEEAQERAWRPVWAPRRPLLVSTWSTTRSPHLARPGQVLSPLRPRSESRGRELRPPMYQLRMSAPSRSSFCHRRKERRQVLFAIRRAGYSGSAPGPYRRTQDSQYSCRS